MREIGFDWELGGMMGGGGAWSPADWAKTGYAPMWDIWGKNYQDTTGQTLAEDPPDSIALMIDGGKVKREGEEVANSTFIADTDWDYTDFGSPSSSGDIAGGKINLPRTDVSNYARGHQTLNLEPGSLYEIIGSDAVGTMQVRIGNSVSNAAAGAFNIGDGQTEGKFFFCTIAAQVITLLPQDDGSTNSLGGVSVKKITGYQASNAVTSQQPRIDEIEVEVLGDEIWTGAGASTQTGWTDNGDGTYTADGTQAGLSYVWKSVGIVVDKDYKTVLELSGVTAGNVLVRTGNSANDVGIGTMRNADGFYEENLVGDGLGDIVWIEADADFVGTVKLSVKEIERTVTHRYPLHDGIDDSLTATLPDMGTQAVVWSADIAQITIEPEATIGAGSYALLADKSIQGVKAGGMTTAEASKLVRFLQKRHTPAKYATIRDRMDTIMMNAVDACFWDTSGWRDSVTGTESWYTETLNTATRGKTQNIPQNALVVAEASRVVIYDGDDPELPMSLVFNRGGVSSATYNMVCGANPNITSVAAVGSVLVVGSTNHATEFGGVAYIDFVNDSAIAYRVSVSGNGRDYQGNIAQRNDGEGHGPGDVHPGIVSQYVNSVAATILSGDVTPTIGIGTDGGVSVIRANGDVWDVTGDAGAAYGYAGYVSFTEDGDLMFGMDSVVKKMIPRAAYRIPVPTADRTVVSDSNIPTDKDFGRVTTGLPVPLGMDSVSGPLRSGPYFYDANGLTITDENMVAYITHEYSTGWMQGDCELCLCDGLTDRSVTGTTVTDNGTAVIAEIADGAEQKKITASGGSITAPVTTGGAIYGWEEVAGTWYYRDNSGWVGVSESGGTLTIADGTTIAMLKYTNGAGPSAAQYAKAETEEDVIRQEASACLLFGATAQVNALAHDADLDLLHVGQSDGVSVFRGLERVTQNDHPCTTALAVNSGMVARK